jgi:hypothetical protein
MHVQDECHDERAHLQQLDHEAEGRHIRQMPFAVGRHDANQPGGGDGKAEEDGPIE